MAVFFYDLLRVSRRGRMVLLRAVYGVLLLVALGGLFVTNFPDQLGFTTGFTRQPLQLVPFAEQFAAICLLVQLGAAAVLAPAVAAGAIAEERQRQTLDLLWACGLSAKTIVLGKLAARTLVLAGIVLTGVPVLALVQLWAEVTPGFLLAGTAINLLTLLTLTALGVYCSALTKSAAAATTLAYVLTAFFVAVAAAWPVARHINPVQLYREWLGMLRFSPGVSAWAGPVIVNAVFHVVATGVLVVAAVRCLRPPQSPPDAELLRRLKILQMRRGFRRDLALVFAAVRSALAVPLSHLIPARSAVRLVPPPRVGNDPLLWKERYYGSGGVADETLRTASYALIVLQPLVILAPEWNLLFDPAETKRLTEAVRSMVLTLGVLMLSVTALGLTTAAATGLSTERERHTLAPLLTLPGGRWDLLRAKWWGSLLRLRAVALAATVPWIVGVLFDAIQPMAIPLLVVAVPAHLLFFASLGVCVSARATGSGRAVLTAVTLAVLLAILPPLLADESLLGRPPLTKVQPSRRDVTVACLSPPVIWQLLASDPREWARLERGGWTLAIVVNALGYATMAGALLAVAHVRLRRDDL
jgi:ABC-type transport system involved in multi-copper enzyme maturation permease subunit